MRRITRFAVVVAVVLIALPLVQLGSARPSIVRAHPAAHPPTPPTYDWDTATAGTQPPTSPRLANPNARLLSTLRLAFPVLVPLEQLQAILPAGYVATEAAPAGSGLASIALQFRFQERLERVGIGTFGPTSGLVASHVARNTALNRLELLILAAEDSTTSAADAFNAVFGPGSSRVANVKAEIEETAGTLEVKFDVEDESIGLDINVKAKGPAAIDARGHGDPAGAPIRGLNNGVSANAAYWFGFMNDFRSVPITSTNFSFRMGPGRYDDGVLGLPGGAVDVVGVGPNFTFLRWHDNHYQLE
jgi:hypothetical protein